MGLHLTILSLMVRRRGYFLGVATREVEVHLFDALRLRFQHVHVQRLPVVGPAEAVAQDLEGDELISTALDGERVGAVGILPKARPKHGYGSLDHSATSQGVVIEGEFEDHEKLRRFFAGCGMYLKTQAVDYGGTQLQLIINGFKDLGRVFSPEH